MSKSDRRTFLGQLGAATVLEAWAFFERQCRDTIRKTLESRIPDGAYEAEDAVDGDGMSGRSFHVRMRLTKESGRIALDARASDDQARGPINFMTNPGLLRTIMEKKILDDGLKAELAKVIKACKVQFVATRKK